MAGGWAQDGAVNDQIEASTQEALARARRRQPSGESLRDCAECGEPIPEPRRAALPGAGLSEHFFVWDEDAATGNYRNAFYATSASTPGLRRFGELTEVTPADVGCRLIWLFGIELATSAKVVSAFSGPTASKVFKTVETDTLRHFAQLSPQS